MSGSDEGDPEYPATKRRRFLMAAGAVSGVNLSACFGAGSSGGSDGDDPPSAESVQFERRPDDNVVRKVDPKLDLGGLVADKRDEVPPPVDLGPALVAGEGPHEDNHTVVRVFDRYQTMVAQFMAYPSSVTGGVEVVAGAFLGAETGPLVATAPLADADVGRVRLFTPEGALQAELEPGAVDPPFLLAAGNLLPGRDGDELAVGSRQPADEEQTVQLYDGAGDAHASVSVSAPSEADRTYALTVDPGEDRDRLRYQHGRHLYAIDPAAEDASPLPELDGLPWNWTTHPSAFDDELWATGPQEVSSRARVVSDGESGETVDVGRRENLFWYWSPHTVDEPSEPGSDEYVGFVPFEHIRVDAGSPQYTDPDYDSDDYEDWVDDDLVDEHRAAYRDHPKIWEPTATHRAFGNQTDAWRTPTYPDGTPKYLMLDEDGKPHGVVEPLERRSGDGEDGDGDDESFRVPGSSDFDYLSYSPKLDAVQHVFHWPLRRFLRGLAPAFRGPDGTPDHLKALVPAHEHEIPPPGDYNPAMIEGFREYLERLYGDVDDINERFGTAFESAAAFDAPRDHDRGAWDAFAVDNEFWLQWLFFNRYVVNRHILTAFSEALLAGFPPEAIKSHQIPDFGQVGDVERITPIDVVLSAGASFGATNYGLFHETPGNWLEGAYTSGHRNVVVGEYHARTSNRQKARAQLEYIFDHGGKHTHVCCTGTESTYAADQAAADALLEQRRPRPGVTGGTGQVHPVTYSTDDREVRYNVVQLGNSETRQGLVNVDLAGGDEAARNGLLKSVDADGNWTGTVYLTPFHAGVDVAPVVESEDVTVASDAATFRLTEALDGEAGWVFQHNDQVEIRFDAVATGGEADLEVAAYADGATTPVDSVQFTVGDGVHPYRYVVHNQLPLADVEFRFRSVTGSREISLRDLSIVAQRRRTARKYFGERTGEPHRGGVRFDVWRDPMPAADRGDGGGQ